MTTRKWFGSSPWVCSGGYIKRGSQGACPPLFIEKNVWTLGPSSDLPPPSPSHSYKNIWIRQWSAMVKGLITVVKQMHSKFVPYVHYHVRILLPGLLAFSWSQRIHSSVVEQFHRNRKGQGCDSRRGSLVSFAELLRNYCWSCVKYVHPATTISCITDSFPGNENICKSPGWK